MKKMLMMATVPSMIGQFNMDNIKLLQEMGYEVHVACNFMDRSVWNEERVQKFLKELEDLNVNYFHTVFSRNVGKFGRHIKSYKQIRKLCLENSYEFIHCHTPLGGVIGRLAGKATNIKVIYTAHGFHFFKAAPLKKWLLYYPIEWICSWMTDVLITINKEDYARANKHMHAKKVEYIPGVGIDTNKFSNCISQEEREKIRRKYNLKESDFVLLSVGELSTRKNHQIVIKALSKLNIPNMKYIICGQGNEKEGLLMLAKKLGVQERVIFMGYQQDIKEFYNISDLFLFPSLQEGLPVALMEAMACGLPVICSPIRGNMDLIVENEGGYFANTIEEYSECIEKLYLDENLRKQYSDKNMDGIKGFEMKKVSEIMKIIYERI